jgi:DNA-binding IclR family transcriptional regulator
MSKSKASGSQSVHRAALVVREIAVNNRNGVRLVDLAARLPLQRPTIHRILKSLVAEKLVSQDTLSRRYYLGQSLFELGLTAGQHFNPRDLCQPVLKRIAEQTEDTVFLSVRTGVEAVCVDRKDGAFPIKIFSLNIGDRRPLGAGAGGLAILSALPDVEMRRIIRLNEPVIRRLGTKGAMPGTLLEAVRKTQRDGYAVHDGELAHVRALGVAIKDKAGTPFAALSYSAIESRVTGSRLSELVPLLKRAAYEIEQLVNHQDLIEWRV